MRLVTAIALLACSFSVQAEQVFLEGFPDVPLLEGMQEQPDSRVVFDAPSGTVAETSILSGRNGNQMLDAYYGELPAFGWQCKRQPSSLRCTREKNVLVFTSNALREKEGVIILRLEPAG